MTTIRKIASEAGVSVGTVSNVINNRDNVSEETRRKVLEVVGRYNYRPSAIARSLSTRKTRTLGLIISLYFTPFYTDLAVGALEAAREADSKLLVVAVDYDASDLPEKVNELIQQWVDGIFIATQPVPDGVLSQLQVKDTPLVLMDRGQAVPQCTVGTVGFDWKGSAYAATEHLINLGHERIGYVGGIPGRSSSILRERGYVEALNAHGIPYNPELMRDGDFFTEGGYQKAGELLRLTAPPTAIFLANDLMALGALKAANELGFRVPKDLSLVGIDDVFFTAFLSPPLTTVHVPTKEAGRAGICMLLDASRHTSVQRVVLPTGLVVRESSAPPQVPFAGTQKAKGADGVKEDDLSEVRTGEVSAD